ncbi:hypothetical protein CcaCcLH18_03398 [Colletotrichum camelliae]|nr:hypothetical protein CcaCcLH18_03398 [Colletotrichum camelliae]
MDQQNVQSEKLLGEDRFPDVTVEQKQMAITALDVSAEFQSDRPLTDMTMNLISWAARVPAGDRYVVAEAAWFRTNPDATAALPTYVPQGYSTGKVILVPVYFDVPDDHWSLLIVHDGFTGLAEARTIRHLDPFKNQNNPERSLKIKAAAMDAFRHLWGPGETYFEDVTTPQSPNAASCGVQQFDPDFFRVQIFKWLVDRNFEPNDPDALERILYAVARWKSENGESGIESLSIGRGDATGNVSQLGDD